VIHARQNHVQKTDYNFERQKNKPRLQRKEYVNRSGRVAELAKASIVCPRDPDSSLGLDNLFKFGLCQIQNSV
jgi:hypothetical protein